MCVCVCVVTCMGGHVRVRESRERVSQCTLICTGQFLPVKLASPLHSSCFFFVRRVEPHLLSQDRLGILGAVHGDGVVRIYAVPQVTPETVAPFSEPGSEFGVAHLCPWGVATLKRTRLTCMAWHPQEVCLFITGAADGTLGMYLMIEWM